MTNYEVIQSMTIKELANFLVETMIYVSPFDDCEKWLRSDSHDVTGLFTDDLKKHWKVH